MEGRRHSIVPNQFLLNLKELQIQDHAQERVNLFGIRAYLK